jgi:hypothetical protein
VSDLNFHKPYATVYEMPGVCYQQDGHFFRRDGSRVQGDVQEREGEDDMVVKKLSNNGMSEDDLRRPENRALKAQLATYGEEWTTRKAAMEFLEKGR